MTNYTSNDSPNKIGAWGCKILYVNSLENYDYSGECQKAVNIRECELMAISKGLEICKSLGISKLTVCTDDQFLAHYFNKMKGIVIKYREFSRIRDFEEVKANTPLARSLWNEIFNHYNKFSYVDIVWVGRDSNEAHKIVHKKLKDLKNT